MVVMRLSPEAEFDQGSRREGMGTYMALAFLERKWFGGRVKGGKGATVARLLFTIYLQYTLGVLMSKKDAMRVIGVEHKATAKTYIDRLIELGAITIATSQLDRRIELLVPTSAGLEMIANEAVDIAMQVEWAKARLDKKYSQATALRPDLDAEPRARRRGIVELDVVNAADRGGDITPSYTQELFVASFSETLRLMPGNHFALAERSMAYRKLKRYEEAFADIQKAIVLEPKEMTYIAVRAEIYRDTKKYDKALRDCDHVLAVDSNNLFALAVRSEVYQDLQDWAAALKDLDALITLREQLHTVFWGRGSVHTRLGHFDEALGDLTTAAELAKGRGLENQARLIKDEIARVRKQMRAAR